MLQRHNLCEVEVTGNDVVENLYLFFIQIVLGYLYVIQTWQFSLEGHQSHKRFLGIDTFVNDLGSGMAMGSIMQFVLDNLEEQAGGFCTRVIVNAGGIDIKHLAIKHLFRRTDVPDAVEQFLPITAAAKVFQPFVIHGESFYDILMQPLCGPLPEARALN